MKFMQAKFLESGSNYFNKLTKLPQETHRLDPLDLRNLLVIMKHSKKGGRYEQYSSS